MSQTKGTCHERKLRDPRSTGQHRQPSVTLFMNRYKRRFPHEAAFLEKVWPEIELAQKKLPGSNRSGTKCIRFILHVNEWGVLTGGGPILYRDGKALITKFPSHLRWWKKDDDAAFARTRHHLAEFKSRWRAKS